jgi:hypothetical protein
MPVYLHRLPFRAGYFKIPVATVLTCVHYLYACYAGLYLLEKVGGVRKLPSGWTSYGGVDYAWTTPIHLPATITLTIVRGFCKENHFCGGLGPLGAMLLLAGSFLTSYFIASFVIQLIRGERIDLGRYGWKAAVVVMGLSWVPVPLPWTLVYYTAVVF